MLKKLRVKFVVISTLSVSIILLFTVLFININNYLNIDKRSNEIMEVIIANDGIFPIKEKNPRDVMSPELPFTTRYFTITLDSNNDIVEINTDRIFAVEKDQAKEYLESVLNNNQQKGYIDDYKYQVGVDNDSTIVVFIDNSHELNLFRKLRNTSITYSTVGVATFCLILVLLSKPAIRPIVDSYEKRKQFITDASHELKTPLTIINSNIDIIEMDHGKSKWTGKVKNQVHIMSNLINDLITLTRIDEANYASTKEKINFSNILNNLISDFDSTVNFELDIDEDIIINGVSDDIKKLLNIVIDNAIKYNNDNKVIISAHKKNKKVFFKITNLADNLEKKNYNNLLERFYRLDSSRNSATGGHGIGLSIADAIVTNHHGKINLYSDDGLKLNVEITL